MTREEAIDRLKEARNGHKEFLSVEALNMAIMALEQEPKQKIGYWVYEPQKRMVDETDEGVVYRTEDRCKCSNCDADYGFTKMKDAYCRYCGAKMA